MTTFFKATRPDGTDFHSGTVDYGAALESGEVVSHPRYRFPGGAGSYLSVATVATDCTGFRWPCRLFEVEAVGDVHVVGSDLPNKRAVAAVRVVRELPAELVFGPQGVEVVALIDRAGTLTANEINRLGAAWDAAGHAAGHAAWDAARGAARGAAWDAARGAARGAAFALVVRDLITRDQYELLTGPWVSVVGAVHPDDVVVPA